MPQFNDIVKAINLAIDDFNTSIPASQKSILDSIQLELKFLDVTNGGDIKTSVANLKIIGKIKSKLQSLVLTDQYTQNVYDFANSFLQVADLQNQYWQALESTFKPGPLLAEIKTQAIADTVSTLTEHGVVANIADALTNILQTAITSGGSYATLTDQLRTALTDQPGSPGLLSQYAKTYTVDALNTFAAQYTHAVSDQLGYEWFAYQGSDIETTRPFCDAMTDFTYFHVSEIPRLLAAENLYYTNKKTGNRELVPIYPKTGLPAGMKPNTTPENFQDLRGGWHCGHQIRPVSIGQVPKYIINRYQIPGIMQKAKEGAPQLQSIGDEYANEFNGRVTPINFKSYESITRKSRDELGGDYTKLKDAVRNTVVVPFDQLDGIAAKLKADKRFFKVKIQDGPEFYGYKGILANIKLKNGTVAEMQVNVPSMIYAKESKANALNVITEAEYNSIAKLTGEPGGLGHEYYDKIRVILDQSATPAEKLLKQKLIKDSENYYSIFYEQNMAAAKAIKDLPTLGQAQKAMEKFSAPQEQTDAITNYTDAGYTGINRYLRKGINRTPEKMANIEQIKKFLESAPGGKGLTYRGLDLGSDEGLYNALLADIKANRVFKDNGFLSTSLDPDEAATFGHNAKYTVKFEIDGKTGVPIMKYSGSPDEKEVLFNIGTKFTVDGFEERVSKSTGQHYLFVHMTEQVNPVLQSTRDAIAKGVVDTRDLYSKKVGDVYVYEPQRAALHDKIVAGIVSQGSTEKGVVYVLGGAPAAGKSTLVKGGSLPYPKDILVLDPDAIKAQLPEYDAMVTVKDSRAAAFTHEESSTIAKEAVKKILDNGLDFVNDSVMDGGVADVEKKIAQYHAAGKTVRADYVTVDTQTSVTRAAERSFKTGREVPEEYVLAMNREISKLVPELVKAKSYDELYLWDSNENTPRLILTQIKGVTKILDQGLYTRFLNKANE